MNTNMTGIMRRGKLIAYTTDIVFILCLMIVLGFLESCECQKYNDEDDLFRYIDLYVSNRVPKEGDNIIYRCRVRLDSRLQSFELDEIRADYSFSLLRDGITLTRNQEVLDRALKPRTYIIYNDLYDDDIEFEVIVSGISRNETGVYECAVYDTNNTRIYGRSRSGSREVDRVGVSVRYYPSDIFPTCSSLIERVYLGTQVTVRCASEEGSPDIDLRWSSQNEALNVSSIQSTQVNFRENGLVVSELILSTTIADKNDVYTCEIYSINFPNTRHTCSVSVKTIWPISLSVHPSMVIANAGDSVQFTCRNHDAVDIIEAWDWNMEPSIIIQSRSATSDNVLTISDIDNQYNATTVYCFGLYDNQWFQSPPAIMYIQESAPPSIDTSTEEIEITSTNLPEYLNQRGNTNWMAAFIGVLVICITCFTILLIVFIFWKRNNTAIHDVNRMPPGSVAAPAHPPVAKAARFQENNSTETNNSTYIGLQQIPRTGQTQDDYTELNLNVRQSKETEDVNGANQDDEYAYAESVVTNLHGGIVEGAIYENADRQPPKYNNLR